MPSSECVWSAASRMPESKRLRKYPELEASTMRCALHSTPSALTTMSVKRASRQSEASSEWCGSPPLSVSLGVDATALAAAAARVVAMPRCRCKGACGRPSFVGR